MKRLKLEDIFKPGGEKLMRTGSIDLDNPINAEFKELFEQTKKEQQEMKDRMEWGQDDCEAMRRPMTV